MLNCKLPTTSLSIVRKNSLKSGKPFREKPEASRTNNKNFSQREGEYTIFSLIEMCMLL